MSYQSHQNSQTSHHKSCLKDEKTILHQSMIASIGHTNRRFGVRLLQTLSLTTKATVSTAIGTVLSLAIGTTAYPWAHQSTRASVQYSLVGLKNPVSVVERTDFNTARDTITEEPETRYLGDTGFLIFLVGLKNPVSVVNVLFISNNRYQIVTNLPHETANGLPFLNKEVIFAVNKTTASTQPNLLLTLVIRTVLTALIVIAIAIFLYEWGIRPIINAKNKAGKLDGGELDSHIDPEEDVAALSSKINLMADQLNVLVREQAEQSRRLEAEAKREKIFTAVTLQIRQFLNQKDILQITVDAIRNSLATERVIIYRVHEDGGGTVIAESVAGDCPRTIDKQINDPCFREHYVQKYKNGRVRAIDNIYQADITDCHISTLEQFAVKANLVAPIVQEKQFVGLLIAHQCSQPRTWLEWEINLFAQLAIQVGFALDQAALLEQLEVISQQQRQQKEALQQRLVEFTDSIEAVSEGDLTVRAKVTAGEIGIIADFFNSIIKSLQQIVIAVKKAAFEVNLAVGENSGAVQQLAFEALKQAEQITRTLEDVNQMTLSIQAVADSAYQAKAVARTAFDIARASSEAMDNTVSSILNLQQTVTETAHKVNRLGESSQEISMVVSLINNIALQTNLLSINASLEMARVGDEGRGFVVVVEEIGDLAAKSVQATTEIQKILENIQLETSDVVKAMSMGSTQVVEGANLVQNAKLSLEQILDLSRQIDQLVQSISSATVSQAQTSAAVAILVKEIAKVSERTSDSSGIVSSSLQKTLEIAQQLQKSVSVFNTGEQN